MIRNRRARAGIALAAAIAVVGALTACTSSSPKTDTGTLTIASSSAPISLNPGETNNGGGALFQELAYEPLIDVDESGALVPALATEWGYDEGSGGTGFTLKLRPDAKFADGEEVTADAVAASINWFSSNATGPTAGSFKGWEVTAAGTDEVKITTPSANPIIPDLLTPNNLGGNIISTAGLADTASLANATFGAGPYVYDAASSVTGDHYTYVPNKNYYDQGRIHFDKVVVKVIASTTSALSALKSGQVDVIQGDVTVAASAKSAGFLQAGAPNGLYGFFLLDREGKLVPALGDQRVRQALEYAIDRESITTAIFGDVGEPTVQPNTPGWDAYDASLESLYPYDPAKAKALLAEAGYADGFSFDIAYSAYDASMTKLIQAVADQLSKVGVTVNLQGSASIGELVTSINSATTPAFALSWGGQTQFANTNQLWLSSSPINPLKNDSVAGIEDAFAAYTQSTSDDRDERAHAVQKVVVDQAVAVPVSRVKSVYLYSPALKGFGVLPNGNLSNPAGWSK